MAVRKAKTASAAKPRASSKAKKPAKRPAKPKTGVKVKPPAKKASAKKSSAKKASAKKAPARKAAAKKVSAKKVLARKTPAKKTSAKKSPARSKRPVKAVDKVVAAARTVKKASVAKAPVADAKIIKELGDLAKYIRAAKREIAAIRPDNVKDEYLPKAADELDAVVAATADATNSIMDACEVVEGVMGKVATEVSDTLMDATTRIYEACTFQDITGQRIGKVVTTMKHIEECIDALIDTFGAKKARSKAKPVHKKTAATKQKEEKKVTDADLLEGPQLGDKAKSQAEIDDLFASFD